MSKEEKSDNSIRVAMIGLIGTLLTVCGGLGGAAISAGVTIWSTDRQARLITLPDQRNDLSIELDTGRIFISPNEMVSLDPAEYYVNLDDGFALRRPLNGWNELEVMTLADLMAENGAAPLSDPLASQPIYRIRYGEPVEVLLDRQAIVDGQPLPGYYIEVLETLYGDEPWHVPYYSAVVVSIYDKGLHLYQSLPDLLMRTYPFSGGHVNRLVAGEDSDFILLQSSVMMENVTMRGQRTTVNNERWLLFAETDESYYVVEIAFMPQSGQPLQVWEDLQEYFHSFRLVR